MYMYKKKLYDYRTYHREKKARLFIGVHEFSFN